MPASDVKSPEKTIPRAIVIGTITVAIIYIASTYAVMRLVPAEQLVQSSAPFADAALTLGAWGPTLISLGALVSIAGAVNGTILILGQIPMAVALDGLAPKVFSKRNLGGSSNISLLMAASLATILLMMNYSQGLIQMFEFLATMSTLAILVPLLVSAIAELKHSFSNARAWASVALVGAVYSLFAIFGSGINVVLWGLLIFFAGLPVYYIGRSTKL